MKYYSCERNVQIVIAVLKASGIRKVIVSPGTTNVCFVGSIQQDPFFEIYSCVDERSAAYMACGLARESGEPVVLSCTGATASRNYYSGLTEAYYSKLPILAITSHQGTDRIGHHIAQNIDRRQLPKDIVKISVDIPMIHDSRDEHYALIEVNKAVLELYRRGGGPVHINLHTRYNTDFSIRELPQCRKIHFHSIHESMPKLPSGKIAIAVGSHRKFTREENQTIESFCERYNAVIFCDHTSGCKGNFCVHASILFSQTLYKTDLNDFSLLIHIGEISAVYLGDIIHAKEVWRVSEDGEVRDTFNRLTHVFEMPELTFFAFYAEKISQPSCLNGKSLAVAFNEIIDEIRFTIPELPFSNAWIAQNTAPFIPADSRVYLGIFNTLRVWNYFDFPETVYGYSNVGGFGIDGVVSSLIGASFVHPGHLYFGIVGDLSFFYEMNAIGNRYIGNNIRIMVINNGMGAEFYLRDNPCSQFGEKAELYMAAAGHFGRQSQNLLCHYAEDIGFEYLHASSKEEYKNIKEYFLSPDMTDKPLLLEIFTKLEDETDVYEKICTAAKDSNVIFRKNISQVLRSVIGQKGVRVIKGCLSI